MQFKGFRIGHFFTKGIWSMRLNEFSTRKAMFFRAIRILIISIRGIYEDKIQQRAAAITLYSLLSIVPIAALGFGIAKGFGYENFLEEKVKDYLRDKAQYFVNETGASSSTIFQGYSDAVDNLITFSNEALARTKGGLIAGIGIILLFWAVMKVLSNVENSFNDIWQVKKGRRYLRKYSDYLSIMIISPVFFITAIAVNVFINHKLVDISKQVEVVHMISPVLFKILKTVPYLLIILLFTLLYLIMPNTKVKFSSGLTGGIIAGIIFQIVQMAYVRFQIGVSSNNAIYGSFAAIPLFIIWIQISWLIVLFGAKISFATQNADMYEFESEAENMSNYSHRIIAMVVIHTIIMNFNAGKKPLTQVELSKILRIPTSILNIVLSDLVRTSILSEVLTENPNIVGFQPAQSIDHFSISYVIENIDKLGEHYAIESKSDLALKLKSINENFFKVFEKSDYNILIKDL